MEGKARLVHSVCLACNAYCGVRGIGEDGKPVSVSGNPYRVIAPLKRSGSRGSGRFQPIELDRGRLLR